MTALPITSTFLIGSRRSLRLIERNLYVYRHGWIVIFSGFFEPLFYLLSIGFGLGALIGTVPGPDGQPISYQLFVAPALLATAAGSASSPSAIARPAAFMKWSRRTSGNSSRTSAAPAATCSRNSRIGTIRHPGSLPTGRWCATSAASTPRSTAKPSS